MASSSLQPHAFSLRIYFFVSPASLPSSPPLTSALLPTACPGVSPTTAEGGPHVPPAHFMQGLQSPRCLPSDSPASGATSSPLSLCPGKQCPRAAGKSPCQGHSPTKEDSCRDAEPCLLWSVRVLDPHACQGEGQRQHITVSLNKMVLLVYLSSTQPFPLLQRNHTTRASDQDRSFICRTVPAAEELLFRGVPGSCMHVYVHTCVCVSLHKSLRYGMHCERAPPKYTPIPETRGGYQDIDTASVLQHRIAICKMSLLLAVSALLNIVSRNFHRVLHEDIQTST